MKLRDEILALLEMLKTAETDNEKLAIFAEIADLQSELLEKLDNLLKTREDFFRKVIQVHLKDSPLKTNLLKSTYLDFIDY